MSVPHKFKSHSNLSVYETVCSVCGAHRVRAEGLRGDHLYDPDNALLSVSEDCDEARRQIGERRKLRGN